MNQTPDILQTPVHDLPWSESLKQLLSLQGFNTLQDLLETEARNWLRYPGFSMHYLQEINSYIDRHHLWEHYKE